MKKGVEVDSALSLGITIKDILTSLLDNKNKLYNDYKNFYFKLNFTTEQWLNLSFSPWIKMDMHTYSNQDKFANIRQNEIQPSPPVHMQWVEEYLLPQLPVQPDNSRLTELKHRINQQKWLPYDPDRQEIWQNLKNF